MTELRWIKICINIFDDEKIRIIEEMPEGDTLITIWFKLLVLAGKKNDCGLIYLTKNIPYTKDTLITILKRPGVIVTLALQTFEKMGMIEIENDIISITNWEKYQNIDKIDKIKEQNRLRQARYREKQKEITSQITLRDATEKKKKKKEEKEINNTEALKILKKTISDYFKKISPEFFKTKIDFQREGTAIKRLAADISTRFKEEDQQIEFFNKAAKAFKDICNNGIGDRKFMQRTAFIPSKMFSQGIWVEVIKAMNNKAVDSKPDYSSYKRKEK